MKIRTVITQDAEVDDRNSLRHLLLCANEFEIQGIVQTASKFHWKGVPGAVKPEKTYRDDFEIGAESGPFDAPFRWPGTEWMWEVIDDYEKDYPKLSVHAEGYPEPEYLRSVTKVGNVGYEGETESPTEGSELIRERILDDDERTLYIQIWGGCNTVARALMDIQSECEGRPGWEELRRKIMNKVVLTACGEQDGSYRSYIAEEWPGIKLVKTLQMFSYAYPWMTMPEGESKDTLRSEFMKREILCGKSALADGYCTWMDGNEYPGEAPTDQFGSNPNIAAEWFGARMGLPAPQKYDFLSEGDSPTYLCLFPWGFRTLEDFSFGGIAGRYGRVENQFNSKGEALDIWDVEKDFYTDRDGNTAEAESMWPFVADIQRDFACRVDWASKTRYDEAEHAPELTVAQGADRAAAAGEAVCISAQSSAPVSFYIYREASAACAEKAKLETRGSTAFLTVPETARPGDRLHVIVRAEAQGHYRLCRFSQIIITVI